MGIINFFKKRRADLQEVEKLKAERNAVSEEIAKMKKNKQDVTSEIERMRDVSQRIKSMEADLAEVDTEGVSRPKKSAVDDARPPEQVLPAPDHFPKGRRQEVRARLSELPDIPVSALQHVAESRALRHDNTMIALGTLDQVYAALVHCLESNCTAPPSRGRLIPQFDGPQYRGQARVEGMYSDGWGQDDFVAIYAFGPQFGTRHWLGRVSPDTYFIEGHQELLDLAEKMGAKVVDALDLSEDFLRKLRSETEPEGEENPDCVRTFKYPYYGRTERICLSADGRMAFSQEAKDLHVWEIVTGKRVRSAGSGLRSMYIWSICVSRDGRLTLYGGNDGELVLWDTTSGTSRCLWYQANPNLADPENAVHCACFSKDSRFAMAGSYNNTLRFWDVGGGKTIRTLEGHEGLVWSVCLSDDHNLALSGSKDKTVRLWDVSTGRCTRTLLGHTDTVSCVCLSCDNRLALSGGRDNTVRLWNLESGQCLRTLEGHTAAVLSVLMSSDNSFAISGSEDGTIRLWDLATGKCAHLFEGHAEAVEALCLSEENRLLLSAGSDNIRQWRLPTLLDETGEPAAAITGPAEGTEEVAAADGHNPAEPDPTASGQSEDLMANLKAKSSDSAAGSTQGAAKTTPDEEPWRAYAKYVSLPVGKDDSEIGSTNMRFHFMFPGPGPEDAFRILSSIPARLRSKLPVPHYEGRSPEHPLNYSVWFERVSITIGEGKELMNLVVSAGGEIYEAFLT